MYQSNKPQQKPAPQTTYVKSAQPKPQAQPQSEGNPDKIGALWEKTDKNGNVYYSGQIEINGETLGIVCFANKYRTEEKHPAYTINKAKPRE